MLYDQKRDRQSLASLIAWLEKQPACRTYDYTDMRGCLVTQWLSAMGEPDCGGLEDSEIEHLFNDAGAFVVKGYPRTFGAALKRARAIMGQP